MNPDKTELLDPSPASFVLHVIEESDVGDCASRRFVHAEQLNMTTDRLVSSRLILLFHLDVYVQDTLATGTSHQIVDIVNRV